MNHYIIRVCTGYLLMLSYHYIVILSADTDCLLPITLILYTYVIVSDMRGNMREVYMIWPHHSLPLPLLVTLRLVMSPHNSIM